MTMKESGKKVKQSLIEATQSVRNKFNEIHNIDLESRRLLEEQFKPITKRLNKLIVGNESVDQPNVGPSNISVRHESTPRRLQKFPRIGRLLNFHASPIHHRRSTAAQSGDSAIGTDSSLTRGRSSLGSTGAIPKQATRSSNANMAPSVDNAVGFDISPPKRRSSLGNMLKKWNQTIFSRGKSKPVSNIRNQIEMENLSEYDPNAASAMGSLDAMSAPDLDITADYDMPSIMDEDKILESDGEVEMGKPYVRVRETPGQNTPKPKKMALSHLSNSQKERSRTARERNKEQDTYDLLQGVKADRVNRTARAKNISRRDIDLQEVKRQMESEGKSAKKTSPDAVNRKRKRKPTEIFQAGEPLKKLRRKEKPGKRRFRFYSVGSKPVSEQPVSEQPGKRITRSQSVAQRMGMGVIDDSVKKYYKNGLFCKNMFTYWNDPNELIQRLRLLISSSSAGHTGHQNEISAIIQGLRDANIIE